VRRWSVVEGGVVECGDHVQLTRRDATRHAA
jgi:hypothetical protein